MLSLQKQAKVDVACSFISKIPVCRSAVVRCSGALTNYKITASSIVCRVNWKPLKGSRDVEVGDTISCAGKGRLEIEEVSKTKKGKYAVKMRRLL